MNDPKTDRSLREVRQWKESLQAERAHLTLEDQVKEIQRGAKRFMEANGLELKLGAIERSRADEPKQSSAVRLLPRAGKISC